MLSSLIDSMTDNPMFTAGAGLVGIGTGVAALRQGLKYADHWARRYFLTTLDIPSHDKSYWWTLQWITENTSRRTQHLSVRTDFIQHDNGSVSTQFRFVPAPGRHWFQFANCWLQVERQRDPQASPMLFGSGGGGGTLRNETLTLTAFTRDRRVLERLLESSRAMALAEEEGKTVLYTSHGHDWRPFGYPRRRRPLHSVVLDRGIAEHLLADVQQFLQNASWYIQRGVPYRRGYLLYGPPGSGKSSFIQSLAGELECNICILNLAERYLSDDRLNLLLSSVPQRSLILLEDVDAAFHHDSRRQKSAAAVEGNTVTFSGFLNALDGVVSSEGRLIFMTTNHVERLDPALLRPGRVDRKVWIGTASAYQIRRMFERFYPMHAQLADAFVEACRGRSVSTAMLQGHFVCYKEDAQQALDHIHELWQEYPDKEQQQVHISINQNS